MNGILCNLPEVWTHMNKHFDVSDMGNVRWKKDGTVLCRHKGRSGYASVMLFGRTRAVHPFVLKAFVPKPSPMFVYCDHVNRDRMDPRLINLRWSNAVLNQLNRGDVRGYQIETRRSPEPRYYPYFRFLGLAYRFPYHYDSAVTVAVYEYWHRRGFEVIEALCSHNLHWKLQRLIIQFWMPILPGNGVDSMKWEREPEYSKLAICGRLS